MPQGFAGRKANQAYTALHPGGRGLGLGIEDKHFFEKTDFFYKLTGASIINACSGFVFAITEEQNGIKLYRRQ